MKNVRPLFISSLVALLAIICQATDDKRFVESFDNTYLLRLEPLVIRAHPDKQIALRTLKGVSKVGDAYIVSISFGLYGKGDEIAEKVFPKVKPFFMSFIDEQKDYYKKSGKVVCGVANSIPIEDKWAKNYTKDEVPTMRFDILGKDRNWFHMKVVYSDRKDDYTVVDFTIVAVE